MDVVIIQIMAERILFQKDRLTVSDAKITVGDSTVFFPSISSTRIFEGRPLLMVGIAGVAGLLSFSLMMFVGARLMGPFFQPKVMAIIMVPMVILVVVGFSYKVKCLFLGIDGSSVAVLKSKERWELEVAQRAIEDAKRVFEAGSKKA